MITKIRTLLQTNRKEIIRFLKFAAVGAIGAVVDFGVYNLLLNPFARWMGEGNQVHAMLTGLGLTSDQIIALAPSLASTVSFVLAIISNFIWNRYWTYPDSRSKPLGRQFVQFFVVNVSGIVIRAPLIALTHRPLAGLVERFLPPLAANAARWGKNLALALAVGIVMFWNFFINRYWTYSDVK
ncbi:MAG: GtrA family protein [Anaerolineae bacterium]|nr:GtrA family protein [Anaerolineae bacterium]